MILSRTSQYALKALIYLASQPGGQPILIREIAAQLGAPCAYLSKTMRILSKGKLIHSFRGRNGGYCLRDKAELIPLMEILLLIEGSRFAQPCMLGVGECRSDTPCPVHCGWQPVKLEILRFLDESCLGQFADEVRSGRCRVADIQLAMLSRGASR